jgi:hypothetical protein
MPKQLYKAEFNNNTGRMESKQQIKNVKTKAKYTFVIGISSLKLSEQLEVMNHEAMNRKAMNPWSCSGTLDEKNERVALIVMPTTDWLDISTQLPEEPAPEFWD